jgi:hypothetical protein
LPQLLDAFAGVLQVEGRPHDQFGVGPLLVGQVIQHVP